MARPIVSVIISAQNEARRVTSCLDSLSNQQTLFPYEVILVDSNSTDDTYALAKRAARQRKNFFVWKEKRPGLAAARNLGARKACGQVLLFTDADCRLAPHWMQELAAPLLREETYPLAAVGGRTVSEFSGFAPNFLERYLDQLFLFWEKERLSPFPAFLPWSPACNFGVKREVFTALGGFDTHWKNAAYDVDFCWRLVLCGFVLGHAPKAKARHSRRHNLRGLVRQMENYAYYNQSLLKTYGRILRLPALTTRHKRWKSQSRRALDLLLETRSLRHAGFRGLDLLGFASGLPGGLRSFLLGPRPDPKFLTTRQGMTPPQLLDQLPRGYAYLHAEGWCYWKAPPEVARKGELILFHPRRQKRFRLNASAWKIWEVKASRGQSEDAALALGEAADNPQVLRHIDELTLDLHTRRLLP